MAQVLAETFEDLDRIRSAPPEDFARIRDFGPVAAESVSRFFSNERTAALVERLRRSGLNFKEPRRERKASAFSGKTVVFTGELVSFTRREAEELVRDLGGTPSSSVSKKTDYVVCGENAGSKAAKAGKLGVPILSEQEFREMARGGS
jgi:DNA ligase (NAD+)